MSRVSTLVVACALLGGVLTTADAHRQRDQPECSRCGITRLSGIKYFPSGVVCATARLGCIDWSSPTEVAEACARVQTFMRDWGYLEATVSPGEVVGLIEVQLGPPYNVNRVAYAGNTTVPDKVVHSVGFLNGDRFNRGILDLSIRNINELGLFEPLTIDDVRIDVNAERRTVDIVFNLTERPLPNGPPN